LIDSIQKSKVSGTYSNDEYVKFNEEIKVVQTNGFSESKHASDECAAQQAKDTAAITNLMKGYSDIQAKPAYKDKYTTYAESHPKSYISVLMAREAKRP
jgi:hypothetical protein